MDVRVPSLLCPSLTSARPLIIREYHDNFIFGMPDQVFYIISFRIENIIDSGNTVPQYSYEFSPCDPLAQCSNESAAVS